MLLTVSKRLEFSASRRLFLRNESSAANERLFGEETNARYGAGRNYVVWFVFTGRVDPATGMLMNISEIKQRAGAVIDDRYDHRFLNEDNPSFGDVVPTAENVAQQLASDVAPLFAGSGAELSAVYLEETQQRGATAFTNGFVESNYEFRFSAARSTMSPHLSREENERIFGVAASPHGHGHAYRVRLTTRAPHGREALVRHAEIDAVSASLREELDHKNLNHEVPGLRDSPMTTEALARYIFDRTAKTLPLHRVRLHERTDFFAEYTSAGDYLLAMQMPFSAVHRLQSYEHSADENVRMYGKCNNPHGHGHLYLAEASVGGSYDPRSGTLFDFVDLQNGMRESLLDWNNRHLDLEVANFRKRPSTGENIVQALWNKLNPRLDQRLVRLRLWETLNNRFTLRKSLA